MRLFQYALLIKNQFNFITFSQTRNFSFIKLIPLCIHVDIVAFPQHKRTLFIKMDNSSFALRSAVNSGQNGIFKFTDYDCIGFDLDNTLVRYKLSELMNLEYDMLSRYMIDVKGYDSKHLKKPFKADIGLIQRGLLVDFDRGNLVQLGSQGVVVKASHGTKFLCNSEIEDMYGPRRIWEEGAMYMRDPIEAWRGPLSNKLRALLDYFDAPSALVFARIINSIDESGNKPLKYNVWPDILDGLIYMFNPENFYLGEGYFHSMKTDINKYVHSVDQNVVNWLKSLRQSGKKLFLLTGSGMSFASLIAEHSLGNEWRSLFDVTISYARKPWFFISNKEEKPFIKYSENVLEEAKICVPNLDCRIIYEQGSWDGLCTALAAATGKEDGGKVLYVGDNLVQDIYAPAKNTKCQTVAICEEMGAHMTFEDSEKLVDQVLLSSDWGSFFGGSGTMSFWSEIINDYSKLCVPSITVCATKPIDFPYKIGYYPNCPIY